MKTRSAEAARLEADYLARVKAAISGRDPSEVDEILESLREHIEEELLETETADDEVTLVQMANVLERLGLPETYAQEEGDTQRTEVATGDEESPRFSKLAIAAALCFPGALLAFAIVGVLGGNTDYAAISCFSVALAGLLLGIAAFVVIRNSRHGLRGRGFAWIGVLLLPVLLIWSVIAYVIWMNAKGAAMEKAAQHIERNVEQMEDLGAKGPQRSRR